MRYLISLFAVLFYGLLLNAQDVKLDINAPAEITAGEPAVIEIKLSKGTLSGFARLQQPFPDAINVKAIESAGADFSFSEGKLNIIWLNLPGQSELVLKYELIADQRVKGDFLLEGRFSYIRESEREEMDVDPKTIHINPSDQVSEDMIVDIQDYVGDFYILGDSGEKLPVVCYREAPYISPSSDGWIVNVLVSRGEVTKLARVEETIPTGYMAENIDGKNAIFSFKGGIAKFLWMTLPEDPYFIVSYKLKSESGSVDEVPEIDGKFSFMLEDNVKNVSIIQKDVELLGMNNQELTDLLSPSGSSGIVTQKPLLILDKPKEEPKPKPVVETKPKPVQEKPVVQEQAVVAAPGVIFKVQLLASVRPIDTDKYFAGQDVGKISGEKDGNLYKYTTGNFKYYKDARAYIEDLFLNTSIEEAFVTAYNNGSRIQVDEALRLTRQKWFK